MLFAFPQLIAVVSYEKAETLIKMQNFQGSIVLHAAVSQEGEGSRGAALGEVSGAWEQ